MRRSSAASTRQTGTLARVNWKSEQLGRHDEEGGERTI